MVYAKDQFGIGQISDRERQVESQIEKIKESYSGSATLVNDFELGFTFCMLWLATICASAK